MAKETLYSVAYEKFVKTGRHGYWKPEIEYLHAIDGAEARIKFCFANPNRRTCKIIAIGPVIGYNVDDSGKNISV
jgi:hypothetical protein